MILKYLRIPEKTLRLTYSLEFVNISFSMSTKSRFNQLLFLLLSPLAIACVRESGMYRGSQNTAIVIITLFCIASFYGIISFRIGKGGLLEALLSLAILLLLFICSLMTKFYFVGICFFAIGLIIFLTGKNKPWSTNREN